jgi:hypothetical protein
VFLVGGASSLVSGFGEDTPQDILPAVNRSRMSRAVASRRAIGAIGNTVSATQ